MWNTQSILMTDIFCRFISGTYIPVINMEIPSMLCFLHFLTVSCRFPWCFRMFPSVFLGFSSSVSPVSYLRFCIFILLSWWLNCVDIFYIKFRFCRLFTVINSTTTISLIKTLYKFRTIKCWFTPNLHMHVIGYYKIQRFGNPAQPSCISHSIDICTVAIKNIKNMHAVSTS